MTGGAATPGDQTWSVLVFDMSRTGEPDGERIIPGFESLAAANAYAEARMRSSVEELRNDAASPDDIRRLWHIYGEDCIVLGEARDGSRLDLYIAVPATPAECEWIALTPRLKRFHAVLLMGNAAGQQAWAGGYLYRYRKPTPATLLAIFRQNAADSMRQRGYSDTTPVDMIVAHNFELFDPPRPAYGDVRPLKRWRVEVDFVCHDVKFGGSNSGVFEWPEAPAGGTLDAMQKALVGDMLALRGDGPDYANYSEVLKSSVEETGDRADYPLDAAETEIPV